MNPKNLKVGRFYRLRHEVNGTGEYHKNWDGGMIITSVVRVTSLFFDRPGTYGVLVYDRTIGSPKDWKEQHEGIHKNSILTVEELSDAEIAAWEL